MEDLPQGQGFGSSMTCRFRTCAGKCHEIQGQIRNPSRHIMSSPRQKKLPCGQMLAGQLNRMMPASVATTSGEAGQTVVAIIY